MSTSRSVISNPQMSLSKSYQASCRQLGGRETRKNKHIKNAKFQSLELFCLELSPVLDDRSDFGFVERARTERTYK